LTLHQRLAAARETLVNAGVNASEAAIDVDLFARTLLGWDRARVILNHHNPVPESLEPQFSSWLERRSRHEPSAYIIGNREFWGLDFHVTPAVLIPRPETELVVEEALAIAKAHGNQGPLRIADVGTGSGNIAVSIAHDLPRCTMVATDVSAEALHIAHTNAVRHGVADRVELVETPYLDAVDGSFDLIAANPPYVRDIDKRALSAVVLHEPDVALFGGMNGLRDIEGVLDTAIQKLRPGGWLVMEFGFGQEDDVRALAGQRPALRVDHTRADLQGLARTAIIQRQ
jgi:release factor glutamine methyltransferase